MLNSKIKTSIDQCILCWLATSSAQNIPNVSPKEVFCYQGDNILIANIASPQSSKNIRENAAVCVSFIDVFVQKGFQLKGQAEIIKKGETSFTQLAEPLLKITEGKYPFNEVFSIKIESAKAIIAPNYILHSDTTEAQQIESAMEAYGVRKI